MILTGTTTSSGFFYLYHCSHLANYSSTLAANVVKGRISTKNLVICPHPESAANALQSIDQKPRALVAIASLQGEFTSACKLTTTRHRNSAMLSSRWRNMEGSIDLKHVRIVSRKMTGFSEQCIGTEQSIYIYIYIDPDLPSYCG